MSEFRIWCIAFFVTLGLMAAASNRGASMNGPDPHLTGFILAFAVACAAVALLGKNKR